MTVFSSGISMYAMALLLKLLLGWDFTTSVLLSALIVLVYIFLGGLTSAIYNEVLQFFLIVFGFAPLVFLGLKDVGGWHGLTAGLRQVALSRGFAPDAWTSTWSVTEQPVVESDGRGVVRHGDGPGIRAVLRLLVHGLPGRAAGAGGGFDVSGAAHAAHRRGAEDAVPVPRRSCPG